MNTRATTGSAWVIQADARALPLPDASVDLIVTSPPYYALRSYTDAGAHYDRQIGSEATPQEYIAALVAKALGRRGIGIDRSADYCRLARWRITDPGELAKAMRVEKPPAEVDGQTALFDVRGGR